MASAFAFASEGFPNVLQRLLAFPLDVITYKSSLYTTNILILWTLLYCLLMPRC